MVVLQNRGLGLLRQLLMVILINVPTTSLGLAMGWVSLASGEGGEGEEGGARVVVAAATTFVASLVGVPLSARAIAFGRKFAIIASSVCFLVCWSLKLCGGGWRVAGARVFAGLGGAGAYSVAPLLAGEMCEGRVRGAAAAALVPAHNAGLLLMYLAADLGLPHSTVLWWCWALSAAHCVVFLFVPESPAFLAAKGRHKEAVNSLSWLRGVGPHHPSLQGELDALPLPDQPQLNPIALFKDMVSVPGRRRAFIITFVAIVGQEACGVYTLMQFAERTFVMARDEGRQYLSNTSLSDFDGNETWLNVSEGVVEASRKVVDGTMLSPARLAVVLGAVQLVASAIALYLVEKVGRRRLLVWCAVATSALLAAGAGGARAGRGALAAAALAGAVAADTLGLQPAPYALLADCFHYQYRSCALMVISGASSAANALEVAALAAAGAAGGVRAGCCWPPPSPRSTRSSPPPPCPRPGDSAQSRYTLNSLPNNRTNFPIANKLVIRQCNVNEIMGNVKSVIR